jgi:hypothetical protein
MGCVEGSGVPVLYIGRTVPKGEILNIKMSIFQDVMTCTLLDVSKKLITFAFSRCITFIRNVGAFPSILMQTHPPKINFCTINRLTMGSHGAQKV